jgi:hypothetical protein
MRIYDIIFPIFIISLTIVFSGLINYAYAQVNETSQTYENPSVGIRFSYPTEWGTVIEKSSQGCHNQPACVLTLDGATDNYGLGFTLGKFSKESCNCESLMDFVKFTYQTLSREKGFSFINDSQTAIGKNYSGWQYQFSVLKDGNTRIGLAVSSRNNDNYYGILASYPNESRAIFLPKFEKFIDSIEFLPIQVAKTPSFMNANESQQSKSSTNIDNNTIFEEKLPPTTVGDRVASLYTKISPTILTSDKKQNPLFQLRLIDNKTGKNITNVNYFLTISKGKKLLLRELFYSKDGPLTLNFQPNQSPVTVNGTTEPFLGGWTSETGPITVSGPVLTEGGQYRYTVEIFGVDNVRNIFKPENAPRFESSFNMNMNETEQTKTEQTKTEQTNHSSMLESSPSGLQILSHNSFTDSVGYLHVVGEVQNNTPTNAQFVQVTGTFYDNNNQVVGTQFTYTNPSDIGSGQKAPFDLTLLSASIPISQIDHYNLIASSQ